MKIHRMFFFWLLLLFGLASCLPNSLFPKSTPIVLPTHEINYTFNVKSKWKLDSVYIIWNPQDITLDSLKGHTCFLGDLGERGSYKNLICLESRNGRLLWAKETGVNRTVDITDKGVLVAYSSPAQLRKFDPETGNLNWTKSLDGTGSLYLSHLENQIQLTTTNPEVLWILDARAEVIGRVRGYRVFLSVEDRNYVNLNGLQVLRTGTNEVLWAYHDMQDLTQAPIFIEDKIFLRDGDNFSGTAYGLDRESGDLLWKVPNIIGNLAYSSDKQLVYALRMEGNLIAIDETTGEETVIATFSSGPFRFFDGVDNCAYQLSYNKEEHILNVYLGDSRQLFAFIVE